jgi:hypothetical protein
MEVLDILEDENTPKPQDQLNITFIATVFRTEQQLHQAQRDLLHVYDR